VRLDGHPLTRIPYIGWLIVTLIAALAGLALEAAIKWCVKSYTIGSGTGQSPNASPSPEA
jgi:hypothetical protein